MGKRGPKPKGKVKIEWSPNFAYAIGLLATDGCLSPSGRHIIFTSKDLDLAQSFQRSLRISSHIGRKASSSVTEKKYYVVQFGDVLFYEFLIRIGITPNKSKTIGEIQVPVKYFFDFLRGVFDGDGCTYSYWDKRWRSSFMFYLCFASASKDFIDWLRAIILRFTGSVGHLSKDGKGSTYQLKYAKKESLNILRKMYPSRGEKIFLARKKLKIDKMLTIVGDRL